MSSTEYKADTRDILFVVNEVLGAKNLCQFPAFSDFNQDLFTMIIKEASTFSEKVLAPLNKLGDQEGCQVKDGTAIPPEGFAEAWKQFGEGSWTGLSSDPEYGGQGLPDLIGVACQEMFFGSNPAFYLAPMLTIGSARLIQGFGTPELRAAYCEKMFTGEWSGSMCLTESQAGSALMDVTSTATKEGDHYSIVGTKIFITWGEHNMTDNIIHLVLARIPGAPQGVKGISLFVVPKYRDDGTFNDVHLVSIEEKMGIHASPTCVLSFGDKKECQGYLLGQANNGMFQMFQLMNEARLQIGVQGLGAAEAAYQFALAYANERVQGVHINAGKNPGASRTVIAKHPDIQRMLMHMKASTEGIRTLIYVCAHYLDLANHGPEEKRGYYQDLADLHIPLAKAFSTDQGYELATMGVQVLGGVGFTKDFPLEQVVRDVKIGSIYEGTNGIQALDLVTRKFTIKNGALLDSLKQELDTINDLQNGPDNIQTLIDEWNTYKNLMFESIENLQSLHTAEGGEGYVLYATNMLAIVSDVMAAFHLLKQALVAEQKLNENKLSGAMSIDQIQGQSTDLFYWNKVKTVEFYLYSVLPRVLAQSKIIQNQSTIPLNISLTN